MGYPNKKSILYHINYTTFDKVKNASNNNRRKNAKCRK